MCASGTYACVSVCFWAETYMYMFKRFKADIHHKNHFNAAQPIHCIVMLYDDEPIDSRRQRDRESKNERTVAQMCLNEKGSVLARLTENE